MSAGHHRRRPAYDHRLPIPFVTLLAVELLANAHFCHCFKLSSLFNRLWSSEETGEERYNSGAKFVLPPRRNLVEEWGEEEYHRKLADAFGVDKVPEPGAEYGVDVSFPIHHATVSNNYAWLDHNLNPDQYSPAPGLSNVPVQPLGDKQKSYQTMIQGCVEHYEDQGVSCLATESQRIDMNLQQPASMQNYTDIGFRKIRAPKEMMEMLTDFWESNKEDQSPESWPVGNTYTNHWTSPTYMVSVEQQKHNGGGLELKKRIWDAAQSTIQAWTGEQLTPCSLYGIRVYKEGSILASHVDRLPLVSSAIINVAQDVDEDWPIEVYAHDGKAYNITMQPGDMLLYESHSVIHGRPFPLKGRYYANVFIHFEPTGHSVRHEAKVHWEDPVASYQNAMEKDDPAVTDEQDGLPSYIVRGSPEETRWRQDHGMKRKKYSPKHKSITFETGSNVCHGAASRGDLDLIQQIAEENEDMIYAKDGNGWQPLHEAVRGGHVDVVEFLLGKGADVNARTHKDKGGSALWWAESTHGENHPVVKALKEAGAISIEPEL